MLVPAHRLLARAGAAEAAAIKAFLTTRVGDVGFAIGLAVMWATARHLRHSRVVERSTGRRCPAATSRWRCCCSSARWASRAQVPLHVWLPDAMAGPTPASALIHAATMVAAGVYLVIRALPIFDAARRGLHVVLVIGLITAIVGGLLAVVQHDIKKVLAYSTISQLGFMFVALGAGSVTVAALFHLVTHAFFKSLLFLGAGVIIHATHTQDMREMGGLAQAMPMTTGDLHHRRAGARRPARLSGFFSKDEILVALMLRAALLAGRAVGRHRPAALRRGAHRVLHDAAVVPGLRRHRELAARTRAIVDARADGRCSRRSPSSSAGRSSVFMRVPGRARRRGPTRSWPGCRSWCSRRRRQAAIWSTGVASVATDRAARRASRLLYGIARRTSSTSTSTYDTLHRAAVLRRSPSWLARLRPRRIDGVGQRRGQWLVAGSRTCCGAP